MRIALLHLAPRTGELAYNRRLLETAIDSAAEMGAEWVVTPELCLPGYEFADILGTEWIVAGRDPSLSDLAARRRITLFIGHPERDALTGRLYNSAFVIGPDGSILGVHRKICVIPGVEAWATRGEEATPVKVPPLAVGILICADAYTPFAAKQLREQGAQILISCAAWGPRPHGPERCWEERTRETGLPLFVCNRTGRDRSLNFEDAETVVVKGGERLVTYSSPDSTVVFIDWDLDSRTLNHYTLRKVSACPLCGGPNGCGLTCAAASESSAESAACWCFSEGFPRELLASVPLEAVNRSCICLGCVRSFKANYTGGV